MGVLAWDQFGGLLGMGLARGLVDFVGQGVHWGVVSWVRADLEFGGRWACSGHACLAALALVKSKTIAP
jgi:hypothetical protein